MKIGIKMITEKFDSLQDTDHLHSISILVI